MGAAVANGPPGQGELRLDNVQLVKTPVSVEITIGTPKVAQSAFPDLTPQSTKKDPGFFGQLFGSDKKGTTSNIVSPSDQAKVQNSLVAGLSLSGHRLPDEGDEERFSVAIEGVFRKGETFADKATIPAADRAALQLDAYPFEVEDKNVYVLYWRGVDVAREEIQQQVSYWAKQVNKSASEPVTYTSTTVSKKKSSLFSSTKTTTTTETKTFKPRVDISLLQTDSYLDSLGKPELKNGNESYLINLDLNQIFDPAEKSRVLLWQPF